MNKKPASSAGFLICIYYVLNRHIRSRSVFGLPLSTHPSLTPLADKIILSFEPPIGDNIGR
jgi:hypothetical protein